MNILGIDPSPDGKHCCACNGTNLLGVVCTCYTMNFSTPVVKLANDADMLKAFFPDIIIIERPVPQGERTRLAHYTTLCIEYGKLLQCLQQLYPNARIFAVPVDVLRYQVCSIEPFSKGKHDPRIKAYMKMQGYGVGNGELFGNSVDEKGRIIKPPDGTHKRDAWVASQFKYDSPVPDKLTGKLNSEYEVTE